jgi:hypothetical protein
MLEQIQGKHILIDGDIVKYRCAASAEKTKYLVEHLIDNTKVITKEYTHCDSYKDATSYTDVQYIWSRKEVQPVEFALQACKTALDSLIGRLNPSKVSIYLSPDRTFRHDIARTKFYKGNRPPEKPKHLKAVEEYLVREHGAVFGNNVEADDEIGRALSGEGDSAVSVSIDKDLLQVPGWHYNWVTDRVQRISPREGDVHFYTQMLTGDATDNIPGLPGCGPAGAAKILSGARSRADLATRVWMCYRGEFTTTDEARRYYLEQAQLLWILRGNGFKGGYHLPDGCELK